MEILDIIQAWQASTGDLVQFQAWDGDEPYVELFRINKVIEGVNSLVITGESLAKAGVDEHEIDYYLELEVMGA